MGYLILNFVDSAHAIISILILIRCIISWLPNINIWLPNINIYKEPVRSIIRMVDIILNPIRKFMFKSGFNLPIDISPIIAIFLINFIARMLRILVIYMFFI